MLRGDSCRTSMTTGEATLGMFMNFSFQALRGHRAGDLGGGDQWHQGRAHQDPGPDRDALQPDGDHGEDHEEDLSERRCTGNSKAQAPALGAQSDVEAPQRDVVARCQMLFVDVCC